jgi:hypothetical protein
VLSESHLLSSVALSTVDRESKVGGKRKPLTTTQNCTPIALELCKHGHPSIAAWSFPYLSFAWFKSGTNSTCQSEELAASMGHVQCLENPSTSCLMSNSRLPIIALYKYAGYSLTQNVPLVVCSQCT